MLPPPDRLSSTHLQQGLAGSALAPPCSAKAVTAARQAHRQRNLPQTHAQPTVAWVWPRRPRSPSP
eukprot:6053583-Alexandrium_andersonii.AAC.1